MKQEIIDTDKLANSIRSGHEKAVREAATFNNSTPCLELLRKITTTAQAEGLNLEAELSKDGNKPTRADRVTSFVVKLLELADKAGHPLTMLNDRPYYYNGKFWETLTRLEQGYFFTRAAKALGIGAKEHDALYCKFVSEAVQTFETATRFVLTPSRDCTRLNFINGTLEVRPDGSTLREHRPEDGFLYVLPYEYNPEAKAPKFEKFLREVLQRPEDRANIQEYCGALFSDIRHDRFAYLYGATGNNGKTTFKDIICEALGSANVSAVSLDTLTENTNAGSSARAQLEGKLLNACGEVENKIKSSALLKALASREPLEVRKLYENPRKMTQYARMLFCCNDLPQFTQGAANAEARRFLFIEFDITISRDKINPYLTRDIVADELPGVLNWMLEGLARFAAQGGKFSVNQHSETIRLQFLEGNNSAFAYLKDQNLVPPTDRNKTLYPGAHIGSVSLQQLYFDGLPYQPDQTKRESYVTFCNQNNRKPMGRNKFKSELERQGFKERRTTQGRFFDIMQLGPGDAEKAQNNSGKLL